MALCGKICLRLQSERTVRRSGPKSSGEKLNSLGQIIMAANAVVGLVDVRMLAPSMPMDNARGQ